MRFARAVFIGAGIWGIAILTALCFVLESPTYGLPAAAHRELAYGFVAVAMAWQVAFIVIGSDPRRLRTMMVPAMLEKFGYVLTATLLYAYDRIPAADAAPAAPDFILGLLFIAAYLKSADGR